MPKDSTIVAALIAAFVTGTVGFKDELRQEYREWKGESAITDSVRVASKPVDSGFVPHDVPGPAKGPKRGGPVTTRPTSLSAPVQSSFTGGEVVTQRQPVQPVATPEELPKEPPKAPIVPAPTPTPAPVVATTAASLTTASLTTASVRAPRSIPKGTEISVKPAAEVCDAELRRGAAISARLTGEVTASDGSKIPAGTPVRVEVVERRVASGDQDPVISLEATSITTSGGSTALETRTLHFALEKPGMMGTVVKGTIIGAVGGAAIGLVLRKDVAKAAAIGGVAGGAIGAAKAASAQACIASGSTVLPFTLLQTVEVQ